MENATYALRIAGGVLIAIMIVSLMVFGFSKVKNYKKQEEISKKDVQSAEFNKEFQSYNKRVVTGYELISLANYTNDINNRYSEDEGYTKVKAYVTLEKDNRLKYISDDYKEMDYPIAKQSKGEKTYNLIEYIENITNPPESNDSKIKKSESEIALIFKQLYFECSYVKYDSNSGRICELDYKQIHVLNE